MFFTVCLNNRFLFAVRLFSNRSQMTSKCGKNKKVAYKAIAECVTDVATCMELNLFVLYNKELNFIRGKTDGRQSCVCPLIDHRQEPIKLENNLGYYIIIKRFSPLEDIKRGQ